MTPRLFFPFCGPATRELPHLVPVPPAPVATVVAAREPAARALSLALCISQMRLYAHSCEQLQTEEAVAGRPEQAAVARDRFLFFRSEARLFETDLYDLCKSLGLGPAGGA